MKKREEIESKYKWDLSCYIKDDKMIEEEFAYIEKTYPNIKKYNKQLGNADMLWQYLKENKEFLIRSGKLSSYIYHSLNQDTSNTKFIKLSNRLSFLYNDISQSLAFVDPQLRALSIKYFKELLQDKRFVNHGRMIESLMKEKKHRINEKTSSLLSKMGLFLGAASDAFDELTTSEIEFEKVVVDGVTYDVNESNYSKLLNNKNREVRKLALKSLMEGYGGKNKTLTSTYLNTCHKNNFYAKLQKFKSFKESALFYEEIPEKVYIKLIEQINKNLPVLHQTFEMRKKFLKLDEIAYYDLLMDLGEEQEFSVEQAIDLVKKATAVLGEEYAKMLNEKFEQNVIDFLPNKDKVTGAYSSGTYGAPSIVLMNFVGNYDSVSTLAHEIGHALHTDFSNKFQPFETSDYAIFVAEVASTVNELLLYNYMMENSDEARKKGFIFELFGQLRSTVFRQTMFSEFEDWAHEQLDNKQPLSYEELNNKYFELCKKYYGEGVELPEELKYEWSRIPHFYNSFYVYKYATGYISALCIVQKLLTDKDYYKKYINFLKGGCSKTPIELLKDIDVDLTTNKPYEMAFKYVKDQIKKARI